MRKGVFLILFLLNVSGAYAQMSPSDLEARCESDAATSRDNSLTAAQNDYYANLFIAAQNRQNAMLDFLSQPNISPQSLQSNLFEINNNYNNNVIVVQRRYRETVNAVWTNYYITLRNCQTRSYPTTQ